MPEYEACPICRCPSLRVDEIPWANIDCFRCGEYRFDPRSREAILELSIENEGKIALISGWIREHQKGLLQKEIIVAQLTRKQATVGEKAEKLLRGLAEHLNVAGEQALLQLARCQSYFELLRGYNPFQKFSLDDDKMREVWFPFYLMGVSHSQNFAELSYLLNDYLVREKRFVSSQTAGLDYKISPAGWAHLDTARKTLDSNQAFVAMWFSEVTDKLWTEGIYPGILAAGYKPFRIDKHDHNNRIDDEIIASIKRSKFLVADFTADSTGQRGGVYFEAGFALGFGQQVIWLCEKEALKAVHFDTRQYNHITWEIDKLPELARALTLRIEATIGRGSYHE
jgi:hypothetical protein